MIASRLPTWLQMVVMALSCAGPSVDTAGCDGSGLGLDFYTKIHCMAGGVSPSIATPAAITRSSHASQDICITTRLQDIIDPCLHSALSCSPPTCTLHLAHSWSVCNCVRRRQLLYSWVHRLCCGRLNLNLFLPRRSSPVWERE